MYSHSTFALFVLTVIRSSSSLLLVFGITLRYVPSNTAAPQSAQRRQKICVLDKLSNFLDREARGGLAVAIRDWTGAVVHLHFPVNNSLQLFI